MSTIHVTTLGSLRIARDGEEIRELPAQPVRCALFLYLAVERGATRDELAALLWPERTTERARHSLSQTLYELRRQLGEEWIDANGERVEATPALTADVLEFLAAADAGRDEHALSLSATGFLEGVHLSATPGFEQWVDRRRSQLARLRREVCRRLTAARIAEGDSEAALTVARRWAEIDPLEDEAHHHLIQLLAAIGRRAEALREYEEYRERIAQELEVEPLEQTCELVARIRRESDGPFRDPYEPDAVPPEDSGNWLALRPTTIPDDEAAAEPPVGTGAEDGMLRGPASVSSAGPPSRRLLGVLAVAIAFGAVLLWSRAGPAPFGEREASAEPDLPGIAVLPFVNMSADPEKEYFSDGITEDLLTSLSRIPELRVISRTSVMRYKRTELPIGEIARDLGVRYVLEGSVRREGNQVRITAQLIDAVSDTHLWAELYDRELSGVFGIQSEIADRIAAALARRLAPADRASIAVGGTSDPAAYDLLLRGREYLNRPGDADLRKYAPAKRFFRRALEVDPGYARAYSGLSEAFLQNVGLSQTTRSDSALFYARRAVAEDRGLAEAAAALGAAHAMAGQRERAEHEFRRALALDPNQSGAMEGIARLSALRGRLDEAVRWQRRALAVDPWSPARLYRLGCFLFDVGDLAGAEAAFARAVELAPDFPDPRFLLAQIHLIRGEPDLADVRMQALVPDAADHPATLMLMGRYLAQRGRYADAEAFLDRSPPLGAPRVFRAFIAKRRGDPLRVTELLPAGQPLRAAERPASTLPPRAELYLHALRGHDDAALATLAAHWRTGLRSDSPDPPEIGVYWLDAEPFLEDLRDDPRFRALLRQMRAELDSMRLLLDR